MNQSETEETIPQYTRQQQQGSRQLHTSATTQSERGTSGSHDPDCDWFITGGSSGGSAVAVATGSAFGYHNIFLSES